MSSLMKEDCTPCIHPAKSTLADTDTSVPTRKCNWNHAAMLPASKHLTVCWKLNTHSHWSQQPDMDQTRQPASLGVSGGVNKILCTSNESLFINVLGINQQHESLPYFVSTVSVCLFLLLPPTREFIWFVSVNCFKEEDSFEYTKLFLELRNGRLHFDSTFTIKQ